MALTLVGRGLAPVLVLAEGDPRSDRYRAEVPPGIEVVRFTPDPFTTRGEARFVARLARQRNWRKVIVVAGRSQIGRARLRFERCWPEGRLLVTSPGEPVAAFDVIYEIGATMKALTYERGC